VLSRNVAQSNRNTVYCHTFSVWVWATATLAQMERLLAHFG